MYKINKTLGDEIVVNLNDIEYFQKILNRINYPTRKTDYGKKYEIFVGQHYEKLKYKTKYYGQLKGLKDGGVDLICENKKEVLLIQCKYRKQTSLVHVNAISQLVGIKPLILNDIKLENRDVKLIVVTSSNFDNQAKKLAKIQKVELVDNFAMPKEIPLVKCIPESKIFHIPYNSNYFTLDMTKKNRFYVNGIQEAVNMGYSIAENGIYYKKPKHKITYIQKNNISTNTKLKNENNSSNHLNNATENNEEKHNHLGLIVFIVSMLYFIACAVNK